MGFICPGGREMFSPIQFFTLATESLLQQILVLLITMSLITENNCRSYPAIVLMQRSAWVAFAAILHTLRLASWLCKTRRTASQLHSFEFTAACRKRRWLQVENTQIRSPFVKSASALAAHHHRVGGDRKLSLWYDVGSPVALN